MIYQVIEIKIYICNYQNYTEISKVRMEKCDNIVVHLEQPHYEQNFVTTFSNCGFKRIIYFRSF